MNIRYLMALAVVVTMAMSGCDNKDDGELSTELIARADYDGKDAELDFDQHEMVALMAPRAVAIASATEDHWAGQYGEFCSAVLASPVWELYGIKGLEAGSAFPSAGNAIQRGNVSYHIRIGKHNLTLEDWNRYMDFADSVFAEKR